MCLIAWNWQPDSNVPLLLLSNRDEWYARPTRPLHWWDDAPLLAGRDLQAGGTWLGVNRLGWLAALTNFRQPAKEEGASPSRGTLVSGFLQGTLDAHAYAGEIAHLIAQHTPPYKPFNLLLFDGTQLIGLESRHQKILRFQPGIGGVSNADFHTPWPKLQRLTQGLQDHIDTGSLRVDALLPLLHDQQAVAATALPDTGIPGNLEKLLSTAFIRSAHYGTRACSVVQIRRASVDFYEQNHAEHGMLSEAQQFFTK